MNLRHTNGLQPKIIHYSLVDDRVGGTRIPKGNVVAWCRQRSGMWNKCL